MIGYDVIMKQYERTVDILDGSSNLDPLLSLYDFPIHMGVTNEAKANDLFCDLVFDISRTTGMIQVRNLIPGEILYQNAHYNNIAHNWAEHHKAFAQFIFKYCPQCIFEPGGGTGLLEKEYSLLKSDINWTIMDAVPNKDEGCTADYVTGFFDEHTKLPVGNYDAIVHSHCMEHFYNPVETLRNMANNMPLGSWMFFSIPNIRAMFEKKFTNILNFEHTYLCSEPYVTWMLKKNGYSLVERKLFKEDHSVFYAAKLEALPVDKINDIKSFKGLYKENCRIFQQWLDYHSDLVKKLNEYIGKVNRPTYLFGAHAFSQYLLAFGLREKDIIAVLDNDETKQGKRLEGTELNVFSPKILADIDNPLVILCAGTHNEEIKKDIIENVNAETKFIP